MTVQRMGGAIRYSSPLRRQGSTQQSTSLHRPRCQRPLAWRGPRQSLASQERRAGVPRCASILLSRPLRWRRISRGERGRSADRHRAPRHFSKRCKLSAPPIRTPLHGHRSSSSAKEG